MLAANFVLAGVFVPAAFFVLAAIFVLAEIFVFCSFCCFTSQVNNYRHGETVSSPNHTFHGKAWKKRLTSTSSSELSGRVLDSRPRDHGFDLHWRLCVVPLSKTH